MASDGSWNSRIPSAPEIRLYRRRYDLTYTLVGVGVYLHGKKARQMLYLRVSFGKGPPVRCFHKDRF